MEYLLAGPQVTIQFDYGHIMVWRNNRTMNADGYETALQFIRGMIDQFPEYLVQQQTQAADG